MLFMSIRTGIKLSKIMTEWQENLLKYKYLPKLNNYINNNNNQELIMQKSTNFNK